MRNYQSSLALGGMAIALSVLGTAHAGIANTKHNLSTSHIGSSRFYTDTTEICLFCHTPHMTVAKSDNIPLWNHQISSTVSTYGTYTSGSFNGAGTIHDVGGATSPANATVTNLCLSCHDGTTAVNALYNASNLSGNVNPSVAGNTPADGKLGATWASNLGTDLTNDHPVNFTYDNALFAADGDLHDPQDTAGTGLGGPKLYNGTVQCASCHDPHIDYSGANSAQTPFLRVAITGSTLCLKCHNK